MKGPAQSDGPMVFVGAAAFDAQRVEIDDGDRHHLERVLRLRAGERMVLCDGRGRWRGARFGPDIEVDGEVVVTHPPTPTLAVGFALLKGDRNELVTQKLTELGVDRIIPMSTEHCVVRWDGAKAIRHHERLTKVAREASMQCRRTHLPTVESLTPYAAIANAASATMGVARADIGGGAPGLALHTILVGPEGGWSPVERDNDLPTIALGAHVLRAETAAIVAGTLLTAVRIGLLDSRTPAPEM